MSAELYYKKKSNNSTDESDDELCLTQVFRYVCGRLFPSKVCVGGGASNSNRSY